MRKNSTLPVSSARVVAKTLGELCNGTVTKEGGNVYRSLVTRAQAGGYQSTTHLDVDSDFRHRSPTLPHHCPYHGNLSITSTFLQQSPLLPLKPLSPIPLNMSSTTTPSRAEPNIVRCCVAYMVFIKVDKLIGEHRLNCNRVAAAVRTTWHGGFTGCNHKNRLLLLLAVSYEHSREQRDLLALELFAPEQQHSAPFLRADQVSIHLPNLTNLTQLAVYRPSNISYRKRSLIYNLGCKGSGDGRDMDIAIW
ncbi:uncharacterized protein BDZ99DRAFT_470899 [Mytilinidion resinicola]|uniref:Uncharacterized protein n=1 Tax=Mytilinidion resinicola TaxID=574789 RepID=A0A6A6ZAU8_9PEZI|nr:uncharacterized protein BDZ99DRAFT_470899 [Mytilinidion resinicola]KAF2817968.1 hypothetical protein BDZ99DRAFT_470899 [Mytilinidion resinicola]